MEDSSYEIGAGGHQTTCFDIATKYGLLLETEFPYEYTFGFDDNNYQQIYEMYKHFAHNYISKNEMTYTTLPIQNGLKNLIKFWTQRHIC